MNWVFFGCAALVLAIVLLEIRGRRQSSTVLVSRDAFLYAVATLRTRGVDGSAIVIQPCDSNMTLEVVKRYSPGESVKFQLQVGTAVGERDMRRLSKFSGTELAPAASSTQSGVHLEGDVRGDWNDKEILEAVELQLEQLGARLLPNARIRFRGSILAFNIPETTGSHH